MGRSRAGLLLAVAASTSCGGGGGERTATQGRAPYLASDGPLHAPVLTRAGEGGAEATTAYAPSETEATALVTLGAEARPGATLVVTWYRIRGDEREELFAHEIEIGGPGQARSQAVAADGLAPGRYETVAALGERRTRTPWLVTASAGGRQLSGVAGSEVSGIEGGASGWDDDSWDAPSQTPPAPDATCRPTTSVRALVELTVFASWNEPCERLTIGASVSGPPETLLTVVTAEQANDVGVQQTSTAVSTGLCDIPNGRDFPGTVVRAVVTDSSGASAAVEDTLEDVGPALQAGIEPTPSSGSRVRGGDRIRIDALALLLNPALGVKTLYVSANDELVEATGNLSGSSEPRPCDLRRLIAALRTEYRVPEDPPPTLEICATAVGFDGTEASDCAQFVTRDVEVWEGTWDAGFHVIGSCTPAVWPQVGTLRATVAADGSLTGRGDLVNHTGVCGGTDRPQRVPVTPLFTGRVTDDEVLMEIQLPGLGTRTIPMRREGDVAEGSATIPLGGGSRWEIRSRLECTTC